MNATIRSFNDLAAGQWPSAGGKGGALARLYQAGYPVPDGIVILPGAFAGDVLAPDAWSQVQAQLDRLRKAGSSAFAVRSSARGEDSTQASFAGEFETVLDVRTDEAIRAAIHTVRQSRHSERVRAYSRAKGMATDHEMSVVVQRLIRADMSGVLFTADPVTGSHARMAGNYVLGLGEALVSGEAEPYTFCLSRPTGRYKGPSELGPFARRLFKLALNLEKDLGAPQDVEWAICERKLYLLQARPITTLRGLDPRTGGQNDSLRGDYLWSNANLSEAVPDVITPLTWSVWDILYTESAITIGSHPLVGNIGGRCYINLSVGVSIYTALGKSLQQAVTELAETFGHVPPGMAVPQIPVSRLSLLRDLIPAIVHRVIKSRQVLKDMSAFLDASPAFCQDMRRQVQQVQSKDELASFWHDVLRPHYIHAIWMLRVATKLSTRVSTALHHELAQKAGAADASALMSNLSAGAELASLGPVVGLARVASGEMSRETYVARYGHRGPHECELMSPRPAEDPLWLDEQLAEFDRSPFDVDALLSRRRAQFDAAWQRFAARYGRKANRTRRKIEKAAVAARRREAVRSEITRTVWVIRTFAVRAGELTGLGDGVFFLSLDELLQVLAGDTAPAAFIPARRETHARHSALPVYPTIIRGRFDPVAWAADPQRRSDCYDAHAPFAVPDSDAIRGFSGAAGRVEGRVRRLDRAEEGSQLQVGEILVTTTTNVGWTPLFPRAAAIVTDVGAPLSHAAIVARELGIPAVVGCGDATMRLHTGDRVRVDGGQGIIQKL